MTRTLANKLETGGSIYTKAEIISIIRYSLFVSAHQWAWAQNRAKKCDKSIANSKRRIVFVQRNTTFTDIALPDSRTMLPTLRPAMTKACREALAAVTDLIREH